MPDPGDHRTTRPETGSPGPHPVLEDIAKAAGVISDASGYLSPTREYDEPSLEKGDWPRDLNGPETLRMVEHLADIAYGASRCITGITCQHAIPDAAKPGLDVIADLLAEAGRKLSALTEDPGREAGATVPEQHVTRTQRELAAENFPHGPTACRNLAPLPEPPPVGARTAPSAGAWVRAQGLRAARPALRGRPGHKDTYEPHHPCVSRQVPAQPLPRSRNPGSSCN